LGALAVFELELAGPISKGKLFVSSTFFIRSLIIFKVAMHLRQLYSGKLPSSAHSLCATLSARILINIPTKLFEFLILFIYLLLLIIIMIIIIIVIVMMIIIL
jgi:hypothetical protein